MARVVTVAAAQTGPVTDTGEPAIVDAAIAMIDEARAASRPLYQAIPQFPEEITPRVESFLREPLMQQALRRGADS